MRKALLGLVIAVLLLFGSWWLAGEGEWVGRSLAARPEASLSTSESATRAVTRGRARRREAPVDLSGAQTERDEVAVHSIRSTNDRERTYRGVVVDDLGGPVPNAAVTTDSMCANDVLWHGRSRSFVLEPPFSDVGPSDWSWTNAKGEFSLEASIHAELIAVYAPQHFAEVFNIATLKHGERTDDLELRLPDHSALKVELARIIHK